MHIGLLASDLSLRHGWGAYSVNVIRALSAAGVRLTVLSARNTPHPPAVDLPSGVQVVPVLPALDPRASRFPLRLVAALPHVRRALAACDLLHALAEPYAPLAHWAAQARPFVLTGHGSYVRVDRAWRLPVRLLYAAAFRRAGAVVCVSRYTARVLASVVPGVQTTVINNGVDAAHFGALQRWDVDNVFGIDVRGRPTVLSVGAVKRRKGTLELVRSAAVLRARVPAAQTVIIGSLTMEPAYVDQVRAEIAALDVGDCVHLLGYVPDAALVGWYSAATVFALPSMNAGWKFEGYGLSLLEASAAGLPVVGTRDCGAEDAVDDGVTGLLVSQTEIARELPDALVRLLTDPRRAAAMGAAGRTKAHAQTWATSAAALLALYRRLLAPAHPTHTNG